MSVRIACRRRYTCGSAASGDGGSRLGDVRCHRLAVSDDYTGRLTRAACGPPFASSESIVWVSPASQPIAQELVSQYLFHILLDGYTSHAWLAVASAHNASPCGWAVADENLSVS